MTQFPEGPGTSPGFLLWRLTLAWQRAIAEALAPLGLTHVQFVLLACTWWMSGRGSPPNQLQLAQQAGTEVRMTSEVLRRLEGKGLLTREVDAVDTRARRISPTEAGTKLASRAIAAVEQVDARFFDVDVDADQLTTLLQRVLVSRADDLEAHTSG